MNTEKNLNEITNENENKSLGKSWKWVIVIEGVLLLITWGVMVWLHKK